MADDLSSWQRSIESLRDDRLANHPTAGVHAKVLEDARARWEGLVVARTSMADLLFTRLGEPYPFRYEVHVSSRDGVYEFRLTDRGLLVAADKCFEPNVPVVLDSFLYQLAGEDAPGSNAIPT